MSSSVNKVILIGNLGADPELKYTSANKAVCNLRIATSEKRKGKDEVTEWHRVTVWGEQADACAKYLAKGRTVYVEGKIQTRSWDDKDGNKRYQAEIVADRVQFLGGGGNDSGRKQPGHNPPQGGPDDSDIPFSPVKDSW